jgi:ABC-2 type transport system permease protein
MLMQLLAIARNTWMESIRQPIFFILILLAGVLQVLSTAGTGFTMEYSSTAEVSGDNKLLLDLGLASVFVCSMLLAAFIATAVMSREIERRTVLTVVSKPVPRPVLVAGKYLGVAGAILVAAFIMVLSLLLAIRHGVLTAAGDPYDGPVILFSTLALILAFAVAAWFNFFYGSYFSQVFVLVLLPAMLAAYVLVLLVDHGWRWQPVDTDFKPQISLASAALIMAILVLTAVATAASTRLGQVMTVVACAGVFVFGLLSNHLLGRHAFRNHPVGEVARAEPADIDQLPFQSLRDAYVLTLSEDATVTLRPGDPAYYGPSPNGLLLAVPAQERFTGDPADDAAKFGRQVPPGVIITGVSGRNLTIQQVGSRALPVTRPPRAGDYLFAEPTRVSWAPLVLWAVIPNMQHFWLVDAVTQNRPIPPGHIARLGGYAAAQIVLFLSLAVILFQRRDVG